MEPKGKPSDGILENHTNNSSIVFSCWTRTLDLVSVHLRQKKIPFQRIDGGQVLSQRQANMDRFVKYKEYPILLMSTGVGAFGYADVKNVTKSASG